MKQCVPLYNISVSMCMFNKILMPYRYKNGYFSSGVCQNK